MGLFTPRISSIQLAQIKMALKQVNECASLINKTVKPDVFFGRLNFCLDLLMDLQRYEKYKVFKHGLPSKDYLRVLSNLEKTVNDFIDRATENELHKINNLKTEKAKKARTEKFVIAMLTAFEMSNSFWKGNGVSPHYTGPLYTANNINYLRSIVDPMVQIQS